MVRVHFLLEDLLVEAPAGATLQRIAEGLEHCSDPGAEERDYLRSLDAPPDQRLACQVCVHGDIAVDYLGL